MNRVPIADQLNMKNQHPHNLWVDRHKIFEETGFDVRDIIGEEEGKLTMQPFVDIMNLIIWAYSTPRRAIFSSITILSACIHFGVITIPPIVFLIGKWVGAGMVATAVGVATREVVIKINGKVIKD